MPKSDKDISRFLSLVLRHDPGQIGIVLDPQGWVAIDALLSALPFSLTPDDLVRIVRDSEKQRFALSADGVSIRANQGHSVDVDLGLAPCDPPPVLFHGTVAHFVPQIMKEGLSKRQRHHVHLSHDTQTAAMVGARRGDPVILAIDADRMASDGHVFFRSENGVWLTDHVPPRYLTPTT